jgi:hypothetical protein
MWPRDSFASAYSALALRKGFGQDTKILSIHVRNRSVAGLPMEALGAQISSFAQSHDLVPLLVAVGAAHDDPGVARALSRHLSCRHVLLDDPLGLREITAAFANARLYIGASLHGYIASAAYGVPGVLVSRPAYKKFKGFLEHIDRKQDSAKDWLDAFQIAEERVRDGRSVGMPSHTLAALDAHWDNIRLAIANPLSKRAQRQKFINELFRLGLAAGGPGWALRPFLGPTSLYGRDVSSGGRSLWGKRNYE